MVWVLGPRVSVPGPHPVSSGVAALTPRPWGLSPKTPCGLMDTLGLNSPGMCEYLRGDVPRSSVARERLTEGGGSPILWPHQGHTLRFSPCPRVALGDKQRLSCTSDLTLVGLLQHLVQQLPNNVIFSYHGRGAVVTSFLLMKSMSLVKLFSLYVILFKVVETIGDVERGLGVLVSLFLYWFIHGLISSQNTRIGILISH